jgi:hypothetical protein
MFGSLLSPTNAEVYDLASFMIKPAPNNLFSYFQFNTCFAKSSWVSLSKFGNHQTKGCCGQEQGKSLLPRSFLPNSFLGGVIIQIPYFLYPRVKRVR